MLILIHTSVGLRIESLFLKIQLEVAVNFYTQVTIHLNKTENKNFFLNELLMNSVSPYFCNWGPENQNVSYYIY